MKKRLFSGIQPSGVIHIGNYLGAIKNWVNLIENYDCIFSVVDYHAITQKYDPKDLKKRVLDSTKICIAAGLDPERCTIFIQSQVTEHTELAWILNTITPVVDLERMTQYKDKKVQNIDNINAGLLTYPVLMAADIIIYKADAVPVGEDQKQHLEITRRIVKRFNDTFGPTFPNPRIIISEATRVKGLDGNAKMSKSLNNYIALIEGKEDIWEKLKIAITDPARKRRKDPGNPYICNIFSLHKYFSSEKEIEYISVNCKNAGIGCIDCKKILSENINSVISPIREKNKELDNKINYIKDVLESGRKRCSRIARETMKEVKEKIGVI